MRKLIFILFCTSLFAQEKTLKWDSAELISYFTRNLRNIESVGGKTWVAIPLEQTLNTTAKTMIIEGYPVQYKHTSEIGEFVGAEDLEVEILKLKTKAIYFNFETKRITDVDLNVDDDVFRRPKDLKEKVEDKIKKTEVKK